MDAPEKFDPSDLQECSGDKNLFRNPFKVYENFKSVYKGVRKTRTSAATTMQYDVTAATTEDRMSTDNYVGSLSNDDSGGSDIGIADNGVIVVSVNTLNSLEPSQDCGSASPRSDGNTTDDSGIDSICDRFLNDAAKAPEERKKSTMSSATTTTTSKSAFAAFALDDHFEPLKQSPSSKAKSMLQDTYGSLKRHTGMMDHHPWRRDFVLMQGSAKMKKANSKEDLLLTTGSSADNVELTSVRSKVKQTVQALETKYGKNGEPQQTAPSPIYSTINRATKKNKRNNVNVDAKDEQTEPILPPKISLSDLRMPVEEEVTDISEITQLLSNTNELLNRSSHLRASLTVSVRHANKKSGQTATFLFPTKKKEGGKKSKRPKQGLWNNLLRKSREDLTVESDTENSSDASETVAENAAAKQLPHAEMKVSKYEEANARIAAKFEKDRCTEISSKSSQEAVTSPEPVTSSDDDREHDVRDESDEEDKLAPASTPFVRHNPARRALGPGATVDIRRSIRLAPKTVANLASKFDNLLVNDGAGKNVTAQTSSQVEAPKTVLPDKELKLCKKDISKIIDALNKLEDDAKSSSVPASKSTTTATTTSKPRATVVTSSRFTTTANVRKSLRMKHGGLALASKTGSGKGSSELTKKNSVRRPHKEVELTPVKIEDGHEQVTDQSKDEDKKIGTSSQPILPPGRSVPTIPAPRYSIKENEITSKMQNAKSILSSVELPSETAYLNKSLSLTDRYLRKLATLAEVNGSGVQLKTPPAIVVKKDLMPADPAQANAQVAAIKIIDEAKGNSREGSVYSYETVGPRSLRYLDLVGYTDGKKALNHSYADLSGSRGSMTSAYDDVKPPSVHTYLSVANKMGSSEQVNQLRRSASEDNLSLRYDPVDISILVTARPAIVREDQLDSLSYVYDDVGSASYYGGQDGPGLYESIAGSILNLARNKIGFDVASVENLYASLTKTSAGSGSKSGATSVHQDEELAAPGPHEVLSYTLAKWSAAHWNETRHLSSARSSNRSSERKSIISDKSDEWIDLEDEDDYENSPTPMVQNFTR